MDSDLSQHLTDIIVTEPISGGKKKDLLWRYCHDYSKHTLPFHLSGCFSHPLIPLSEPAAACDPSWSDPGVDGACAVQQPPSVPGTSDGLNEEKQSKPSEEAAEDGSCHNHQWRHHHKAQND